MLNQLYFRRQFLLARTLIDQLLSWQHFEVGKVHLFAHPDLEVTLEEVPTALVILLGYIFDPSNPAKTNEEIISDVISRIGSFEDLITAVKPYTGRYALIYKDVNSFKMLHDPLGLREVYYCTKPNIVICGSQPNLLDTFSAPKLGITKDQNILHFYEHDMKQVRSGRLWVGDETYYRNLKHLMPNHYLDIRSLTAKRYWPNKRLERIDFHIAIKQSCDYVKGVLKAVTSRYSPMMAVTAGIDSRSLLAASREIQDQIYYFINKHKHLNDESTDISIPRSIFGRLNIPFHVHKVDDHVDADFRNFFLNNVFMSNELLLPAIYSVYYKNHQDKVNLLGVGEIGREYYGAAPHDLDGYYLAHCLKYRNSRYATIQCEKWLNETKEIAAACNVDIMRLLLWEVLLGNWGVVGNSESDIAIEEFDPYDSHYIYEIMLSVDPTQGDLFEGMFREMWPELLEFPFNPPEPPETLSDWIRHGLNRLGLFQYLKRGRYRFDRLRFHRSVKN